MPRGLAWGLPLIAACASTAPAGGDGMPSQPATYRLYITNESSDVVTRVAFTPGTGARVEARTNVGMSITDIDGPHGIVVSADGSFWYVSLAHGTPFGSVWKYATGVDTLAGRVSLGLFPASMSLTPDGNFLYVVNFNLHGDMVPSTVSIVYTPSMTEVARPTTCVMPHGSRFDETGARQYSTCMMSDQLVEIDTRTFQVSRRFSLAPGHEGLLDPGNTEGHGVHAGPSAQVCSPTWAQPGRGPRARFVYVPCNKAGAVVEVDLAAGRITRRFTTGKGPYNLAINASGNLLLATLKGAQAVSIIDLVSGLERARIATSRPVTHGVVMSPDGKFAFVTNEAVGSSRGTLDIIDLDKLAIVTTLELERQPGGLDLWISRN
jgi:DNA-binding beta-propeller fold protein YncE